MRLARAIESMEPSERQILARGLQPLVRTIGVDTGVTPMFFDISANDRPAVWTVISGIFPALT